MPKKIRIHKFFIIPILSIYDDNDNLVAEHSFKQIKHFKTNNIDFNELANRLEHECNKETLRIKSKTTIDKRPDRNRKNSPKL